MSVNKGKSTVHGYQNQNEPLFQVATVVSNSKDPLKSPDRYQCRINGDESDTVNMPDEDLQFYTAMRSGESSILGKGKSTRILPGDQCIIARIGNERIILGTISAADPQSGETSDTNPYTQNHTSSPKSTPARTESKTFGLPELRSEITSTTQALKKQIKREGSFKKKAEEKSKNKYNRTAARFKDAEFLSISSEIPFDNTQNPMKFIKDKIGNKGSVFPSMLDMVQQLKDKPDSWNPNAIQAVGGGNYAQFISQFSSFFKDLIKKQKEENKDVQKQERKDAREQALLEQALKYKRQDEQNG